uniref:Uncharacterized protein n=1 Tax=Alexandrium catenella TaxID=2925 RepID=A0A7S1WNA8_ALECA
MAQGCPPSATICSPLHRFPAKQELCSRAPAPMGAVLGEEGCLGRMERPWDGRWEAMVERFGEAERARDACEAERRAKEAVVLLGRQRPSHGKGEVIKKDSGVLDREHNLS